MFCFRCGFELPDGAKFCMECGVEQSTGSRSESDTWEACEIRYQTVKKDGLLTWGTRRFFAEAIGPKGVYTAGNSPEFKGTPEWDGPKSDREDTATALR